MLLPFPTMPPVKELLDQRANLGTGNPFPADRGRVIVHPVAVTEKTEHVRRMLGSSTGSGLAKTVPFLWAGAMNHERGARWRVPWQNRST